MTLNRKIILYISLQNKHAHFLLQVSRFCFFWRWIPGYHHLKPKQLPFWKNETCSDIPCHRWPSPSTPTAAERWRNKASPPWAAPKAPEAISLSSAWRIILSDLDTWLGSPLSHGKAICKGSNPSANQVNNHLLNGMILQVVGEADKNTNVYG